MGGLTFGYTEVSGRGVVPCYGVSFELEFLQEIEDQALRTVATKRQWNLYKRGSIKARKKWKNAFTRKYIKLTKK